MRLPKDPGELYEAVETGIYPSDLDQADWSKWRAMRGNKMVRELLDNKWIYAVHSSWRSEGSIGVWASSYLTYVQDLLRPVRTRGALVDLARKVPMGIELWFDGERVPTAF